MSNNTIRIRTTPLDSPKFIKQQIDQNFDFLEILSLKIGQDQAYKRFCSDYGVIIGRVVVNGGVGVPNAKISVFVPISEVDLQNPSIRALYPFETVGDRDSNNIRYNLLQESPRQDDLCHKAVGTFPQKRRVLDCDPWCEIYGKYFKFTTSTNASGDYMIFGVPTGTHVIHMDTDISDIGYLSQKPYDMIGSGSPIEVFDHLNEFKFSENIDELAQIKTQNQTVNVNSFWGDTDQCIVGINRVDFDLNYNIVPTAFFIGSIWGDSEKNSVNKNCQIRRHLGFLDQMITGPGTIQMIRRTPEGGVESFSIKGDQLIDDDGTWIVQLPMNLDNVITDEFGNLIPSGNPELGLPTKAKYRFRLSMNDYGKGLGRYRSRAHYLVPNWGDYSFDDSTPETTQQGKPNYANLEWNGVYTVKEFISKYSNTETNNKLNFIGIKEVQASTANNPFPFNKFDKDANPLFTILCLIFTFAIIPLLAGINILIGLINIMIGILNEVPFVDIGYIPCLKLILSCGSFCPSCDKNDVDINCNDDISDLSNCFTGTLAESLNVYSFYFSNDWIVGGLYSFLFKDKPKSNNRDKFCNVDIDRSNNGIFGNADLFITDYNCPTEYQTIHELHKGVIKKYDEILYYASNDPVYPSIWLFPTDIYNLGSMKSCDFLGKPKLITEIPTTTFNSLAEVDSLDPNGFLLEKGVDSLLLNINCFGVSTNTTQCTNIYRFCEYGVDNDNNNDDTIDDNDIDSGLVTDPAYIRSELECLNVPSICSNCDNVPEGLFGIDWQNYRTGDLYNNGTTFDERSRVESLHRSNIRNSFYFYFGLLPGKSAIDKIKSQYFAPCERVELCPIVISGTAENNHCIGSSTGSISLFPQGGTPPYKYDWYYEYPNRPTPWLNWANDKLPNLMASNYTVVVKDDVGQKCKKNFTIYDPSPFNVSVNYSSYICAPSGGKSDGYISILPSGGNPPYNIQWLGSPNGASILPNTGNTFYLTGLFPTSVCTHTNVGIGGTGVTSSFYNCIVTDSGGQFNCQGYSALTIDITQACGFNLTSSTINDFCPANHKGSATIGVTNGGVPPFIFILENNNLNYHKSATTTNTFYKFQSLTGSTCPGITYHARVIDSCGFTQNKDVTIIKNKLRRGFIIGDYFNADSFEYCQNDHNYRWYMWDFVSPNPDIIYSESGCINLPDSGPYYASVNTRNGVLNDYGHFSTFPPLNNSNPTRQLILSINGSFINILRRPFDSTNDQLVYTKSVDQIIHGNLPANHLICKSETYITWSTLLCPDDFGGHPCKFTVKSNGCADKITTEFT